jgi:hypothetical protein
MTPVNRDCEPLPGAPGGEALVDDRTRPLLLQQAATRGADDWRHEDAEAVIARLLAEIDSLSGALIPHPALHRSFPDASDGRQMPPMGYDLMAAGLSSEDARFVALQLAQKGMALAPASPVIAGQEAQAVGLRAAIIWARDRIDVDGGMTAAETARTVAELMNVLLGLPSPATDFRPEPWQSPTLTALIAAAQEKRHD